MRVRGAREVLGILGEPQHPDVQHAKSRGYGKSIVEKVKKYYGKSVMEKVLTC
jgi:hypothetical protein